MTQPIDRSSADYKAGHADGSANSKKWYHLKEMWGGLGLFIFLVLIFAVLPMYNSYNAEQLKESKVAACAHAVPADIKACIEAASK